MNKKDLKTGSVVELRNGERYLVVGKTLLDLKELGYFIDLKRYDSQLEFVDGPNGPDETYDIVKVNNRVDFITGFCNDPLRMVYQEPESPIWNWERYPQEEDDSIYIHPTAEDLTILKRLKMFYPDLKYLARDINGDLCGYFSYPIRTSDGYWMRETGGCDIDLSNCNETFKFIKKKDEIPWNVEDVK